MDSDSSDDIEDKNPNNATVNTYAQTLTFVTARTLEKTRITVKKRKSCLPTQRI